jgi:hypothetical protein
MSSRFPEARVTINGTELTEAQSMTLRIALCTFQLDLGVLKGGLLPGMAESYNTHVREILRLIGDTVENGHNAT